MNSLTPSRIESAVKEHFKVNTLSLRGVEYPNGVNPKRTAYFLMHELLGMTGMEIAHHFGIGSKATINKGIGIVRDNKASIQPLIESLPAPKRVVEPTCFELELRACQASTRVQPRVIDSAFAKYFNG